MNKQETLSKRLEDERGRKVIFVAHCILNENARYQGGAVRAGTNVEIIEELQKQDIGIVQMKCPEQKAWGGVQRWLMWLSLGMGGKVTGPILMLFLPFFTLYTKWSWTRIAKNTVGEINDWAKSGYDVVGIIGISGSPSCGVNTTLDLKKGTSYIANIKAADIVRERFNEEGICQAVIDGKGIYIQALQKELARRKLKIPFFEHDLMAELKANKPMFFTGAVPSLGASQGS